MESGYVLTTFWKQNFVKTDEHHSEQGKNISWIEKNKQKIKLLKQVFTISYIRFSFRYIFFVVSSLVLYSWLAELLGRKENSAHFMQIHNLSFSLSALYIDVIFLNTLLEGENSISIVLATSLQADIFFAILSRSF